MAAPTKPTVTSITQEGMRRAKFSEAKITSYASRAEGKWIREIKNAIYLRNRRWEALQKKAILITAKGQTTYNNPSDFSEFHVMELLSGTVTGTAQSGSVSNIVLAATHTLDVVGKEILMTTGTAKGSIARAITYNSSTKSADVAPQFNTAVATGDSYLVVEKKVPLVQGSRANKFTIQSIQSMNEPRYYYPVGDKDYRQFELDPVPDKSTYGIRNIYFANIMTLDTTSALLEQAFERWEELFTQGIFYKALWDRQARTDAKREEDEFNRQLSVIVANEAWGHNDSNLQITINEARQWG